MKHGQAIGKLGVGLVQNVEGQLRRGRLQGGKLREEEDFRKKEKINEGKSRGSKHQRENLEELEFGEGKQGGILYKENSLRKTSTRLYILAKKN
jgi:hypothetical protein